MLSILVLTHRWTFTCTLTQGSKTCFANFCPAGAAVGLCFLRVSFSFLATRLFRILPDIRFRPNLVIVTNTWTTTQAQWWGQRSQWGHWGQKCDFHRKCYFSYRLHGMVMWLKHKHQLYTLYKSYGSRNPPVVIWGHRGQKVIFTKNVISRTDYMPWSWDAYIFISYIPSTKVMSLEIQSGSFGVTGVKSSFSPKMLFLLQIT